jgi:hypothetical protein
MTNQPGSGGISLKGFEAASHGTEFSSYVSALESFDRLEQRNAVLSATLPIGCERKEDLLTASLLSNHRTSATLLGRFAHQNLLELIPLILRRLGLGRISQCRQLCQ